MSALANNDEANRLPAGTITFVGYPNCVQMESPQESGLRIPVPTWKAMCRREEHRVLRRRRAAPNRPKRCGCSKPVDAQQVEQPWLEQIEFFRMLARYSSLTGIVAVVPDKLTLCVWSPALDASGNSSLGMRALEMFAARTALSVF